VASIEHVRRLAALARTQTNLAGVITGKAIYEGTLDLAEALAAARA
jgi:phosphoribosylformimino-5-aminoimidazole carboxamide ribonucleotide (ProFAR) isomerase